jgi:hypothetical protein
MGMESMLDWHKGGRAMYSKLLNLYSQTGFAKTTIQEPLLAFNRWMQGSAYHTSTIQKKAVEIWKEFLESIEHTKTMAPYVLNTVPAAISFLHAEKNRADIQKGEVSPNRALKMAKGEDSLSLFCSFITDLSCKLGANPNSTKTVLPYLYLGLPSIHASVATENYNSFKDLIRNGGQTTAVSLDNEYPIHYAFSRIGDAPSGPYQNIQKIYQNESLRLIRNHLIEHTPDLNVADRAQKTALFYALQNKEDVAYVKALLDKGALPSHKDWKGNTPLHVAASSMNLLGIEALSDQKLNPNAQNHLGKTPLHLACEKQNMECVKRLVSIGADTTLQDLEGKIPLDYFTQENRNRWRRERWNIPLPKNLNLTPHASRCSNEKESFSKNP